MAIKHMTHIYTLERFPSCVQKKDNVTGEWDKKVTIYRKHGLTFKTSRSLDLFKANLSPTSLKVQFWRTVQFVQLAACVQYFSCIGLRSAGHLFLQVNSVWFKLFLYHLTGCGPPSLLLVKGTRLRRLPRVFQVTCRIRSLITWNVLHMIHVYEVQPLTTSDMLID